MKPFRRTTGRIVVLDRADVDTDQIVPKQFLKRIERTGFGEFLFFDWRKDPAFELNRPEYDGARILLAGRNFGCGSSREHAAWALQDFGFEAMVAPSFGDIFAANCAKIGLLPVELPGESVRALMDAVLDDPATRIRVDLEALTVSAPSVQESFAFDDFRRWCLLEGYDDIDLTLRHTDAIASYEASRSSWLPTA